MSYKKATHVLPEELVEEIQKYIDGEYIYIPRITDHKRVWGERTSIRQELHHRNEQIYTEYLAGEHMDSLAEKYFLSLKSIQRIIGQMKKEHEQ